MSGALSYPGVRAILLDIEGTTTPVDFVYVLAELDAAREAEMKTGLCVRDESAEPPGSEKPVCRSFEEISLK
jgi:methionine salvage enolase-phosphatase E1